MKVKISDSVKGEIRIPVMNRTYRAGISVIMTEEEFYHSATQWSIRNGYLVVEENDSESIPEASKGQEFRLLSRNALALRCVGRTINPGEVFFVPQDRVSCDEITLVLEKEIIVKESDYALRISKLPKTKAKKMIVNKNKNEEKEKEKDHKATMKNTVVDGSNIKSDVPKDMYAHIPKEVKDSVKAKNLTGRKSIIVEVDNNSVDTGEIDFVDQNDTGEIDFVDQNNTSKKISKNNEEVI